MIVRFSIFFFKCCITYDDAIYSNLTLSGSKLIKKKTFISEYKLSSSLEIKKQVTFNPKHKVVVVNYITLSPKKI